jgi:hypothetical protein
VGAFVAYAATGRRDGDGDCNADYWVCVCVRFFGAGFDDGGEGGVGRPGDFRARSAFGAFGEILVSGCNVSFLNLFLVD